MTDEELVEEIAFGDEKALAALYRSRRGSLPEAHCPPVDPCRQLYRRAVTVLHTKITGGRLLTRLCRPSCPSVPGTAVPTKVAQDSFDRLRKLTSGASRVDARFAGPSCPLACWFLCEAGEYCVDDKVCVSLVQRPVSQEETVVDSAEDHIRDVSEV